MSKPMFLILFTALAFAMSGCGKSNGSAAAPSPYVGPQGNYPSGGGTLGSACTPVNSPISFQGSMYIDSANVIAGANMPVQGGGYGTTYGGAIQMASQNYYPSNAYGYITIQAQMISATSANAGGMLQLSQAAIQQIMMQMGYGGVSYNQIPCASIISINLGHYNTTLYGGQVTLLINNQIQYPVYF